MFLYKGQFHNKNVLQHAKSFYTLQQNFEKFFADYGLSLQLSVKYIWQLDGRDIFEDIYLFKAGNQWSKQPNFQKNKYWKISKLFEV